MHTCFYCDSMYIVIIILDFWISKNIFCLGLFYKLKFVFLFIKTLINRIDMKKTCILCHASHKALNSKLYDQREGR